MTAEVMAVLKAQCHDFTAAADLALAQRGLPALTEILRQLANLESDARAVGLTALADTSLQQCRLLRGRYDGAVLNQASAALKAALQVEMSSQGWDVHVRASGPMVVFLHPGHLYVAAGACQVVTIVGSCVAVTLYDQDAAVGGMNHFMLPGPHGPEKSLRYGVDAMPALLTAVINAGARRQRLRAGIYGGGSIIAARQGGPMRGPGGENAAFAAAFLERSGCAVTRRDVGGDYGRRIEFSLADGAATVQRI